MFLLRMWYISNSGLGFSRLCSVVLLNTGLTIGGSHVWKNSSKSSWAPYVGRTDLLNELRLRGTFCRGWARAAWPPVAGRCPCAGPYASLALSAESGFANGFANGFPASMLAATRRSRAPSCKFYIWRGVPCPRSPQMKREVSTLQLEQIQNKFLQQIQKQPDKIKSANNMPGARLEFIYDKYRVLDRAIQSELEKKLHQKEPDVAKKQRQPSARKQVALQPQY